MGTSSATDLSRKFAEEMSQALFQNIFRPLLLIVLGVVLCLLLWVVLCLLLWVLVKALLYYPTIYRKMTHKSFLSVLFNRGRYGEYLIYRRLKGQEQTGGRFLFNAYLTKEDGTTTEADVILVNRQGVFVFESKNYSGWIFGNEHQKNWTQCLPQGKGRKALKTQFLNPIFQNKLHIKTLERYIGNGVPCYSVIAFSERCTLKDVEVTDAFIRVVNRQRVASAVAELGRLSAVTLTDEQIRTIYETLYPCTQVDEAVKTRHIENIEQMYDKKAAPPAAQPAKEMPAERPSEQAPAESEPMICPRCGAILVLRTTKSGPNAGRTFYGCSDFPKCRYMKKI